MVAHMPWGSLHVLYVELPLVLLKNRYNLKKLTYDERKASLLKRLNAINSSGGADDDEDDEWNKIIQYHL